MQGLKLNGVSYRYGKAARNALDGVSCEFRAGEVAAVVGPSGSGKTTTAHLLQRELGKLGVHAEMFETVKGLGNGVGYASYSQLYGVAVVDKLGYRLAYGKVFFIAGSVGYFGYCVIGVDKIIHLVYRYKDISECAGHVGIDFKLSLIHI